VSAFRTTSEYSERRSPRAAQTAQSARINRSGWSKGSAALVRRVDGVDARVEAGRAGVVPVRRQSRNGRPVVAG